MRLFLFLIPGLILLGFAIGLLYLRVVWREWRVRKEGVAVNGTIVRKRRRSGTRWSDAYEVTCTYTVKQRLYRCKKYVSKQHFKNWVEGTAVKMLYLASKPQLVVLAEDKTEIKVYSLMGSFTCLLMAVVMAVIFFAPHQ